MISRGIQEIEGPCEEVVLRHLGGFIGCHGLRAQEAQVLWTWLSLARGFQREHGNERQGGDGQGVCLCSLLHWDIEKRVVDGESAWG
jgi:hypothetical protein